MGKIAASALLCFLLVAAQTAQAGPVNISIVDSSGKPLANTVVSLIANGAAEQSVQAAGPALASDAVIDQNHEMFNPLVTVIRRGGRVVFTNSDQTMHQVYSFSPAKQFEYNVDRGQKSPAIVFDQSGVIAIGCNIHDQMITYVYVTDNRWTARSGADGKVHFDAVPSGSFRVEAWHPSLSPRADRPAQALNVTDAAANVTMTVPISASAMSGMPMPMHSHKQAY